MSISGEAVIVFGLFLDRKQRSGLPWETIEDVGEDEFNAFLAQIGLPNDVEGLCGRDVPDRLVEGGYTPYLIIESHGNDIEQIHVQVFESRVTETRQRNGNDDGIVLFDLSTLQAPPEWEERLRVFCQVVGVKGRIGWMVVREVSY